MFSQRKMVLWDQTQSRYTPVEDKRSLVYILLKTFLGEKCRHGQVYCGVLLYLARREDRLVSKLFSKVLTTIVTECHPGIRYGWLHACRWMVSVERYNQIMRCPWCNGYRRRKWTRQHEFKSWTRLIEFHIVLIPLGKVCIQLFSLQLWVNSRTH